MKAGQRRAIGAAAIVLFLVVYIVAVASLSGAIANWPAWGQLAFYALAGFAWVIPLRPLFAWMAKAADPPHT